MGFTVVRRLEDLKKYESKWAGLQKNESFTPFLSYEWIVEWLKFFKKGRKPFILLDEENDELVSLMPLIGSMLRYRFIGYNNSDYIDIIDQKWRFEQIMSLARGAIPGDAIIDLEHIPEDSYFLKYIKENFKDDTAVIPQESCPYMELAPDWEQCKSGLNKRFRKNLEYSIRRLERDFRFDVMKPRSEVDVEVFMKHLIKFHQERWHKKMMPGAFYSERIRQFHVSVAKKLFKKGFLILNAININEKIAAVIYGFKTDRCYYYYLSGFDQNYAKFSLGNVLVGLTVKEAIENGAKIFDFLRGNESYKYLWTDKEKRVYRVIISRGTIVSKALKGGVMAENSIVTYIKEKFS